MHLHRLFFVLGLILSSLEDRVFPHSLLSDILSERAYLAPHTFDLLFRAIDAGNYDSITKADLYSKLSVNLSPEGLQLSYQMLRELSRERRWQPYAYVKEIEVTHDPVLSARLGGNAEIDDVTSILHGLVDEGWHSFDNLEFFNWDTEEKFQSNAHFLPNTSLSLPKYRGYPLRHSSAIKHLGVTLEKSELWEDLGLSTRVQRLIIGSKNLKSLHMNIVGGGCVIYDDFEFDTWVPGRFPDLEELAFKGYTFTEEGTRHIRDSMDWNHLRRLSIGKECSPKPFLDLMSSSLTSLINLELVIPEMLVKHIEDPEPDSEGSYYFSPLGDILESVGHFLSSVPALEQLRLEGPYHSLIPSIIETHCPSLKRLALHQEEAPRDELLNGPQRQMLNIYELVALGSNCPNLEALTLDLTNTRAEKWPKEHVEILLNKKYFPNLKSLSLNLILGLSIDSQDPMLNVDDVRTLHNAMTNHPGAIPELTITVGEWDRYDAFMWPWITRWERRNKLKSSATNAGVVVEGALVDVFDSSD